MYLHTFGFLLLSLLSLLSLQCWSALQLGIDTVNDLNVNYYLGNWYQVYASPIDFTFQGYGKCITANYGLLQNGNISVLNSQINKNNELEEIAGYAYYLNTKQPGRLFVHLDGVPHAAPYWVVKLGEVVDNEYQYSIVTVPSTITLWVLTRDVDLFYKKYNAEVVDFLIENDFRYVTVQQKRCKE